jgi:hypothetical protein
MQSFINNGVFQSSQLWYDLSSKKFHLGGQTIHVATPLNMVNLKLFLVIRRAIWWYHGIHCFFTYVVRFQCSNEEEVLFQGKNEFDVVRLSWQMIPILLLLLWVKRYLGFSLGLKLTFQVCLTEIWLLNDGFFQPMQLVTMILGWSWRKTLLGRWNKFRLSKWKIWISRNHIQARKIGVKVSCSQSI